MSGHLIGCVKALQLPSAQKLALIAFADSADDRTHIAFPGYEGVQEWAGVSRSRAAELVKKLVEAGHVELYRSARPGRRAEYVVFPSGCCALHKPAEEAADLNVDELAAAAGVTVEQARKLLHTLHQGPVVPASNESGGSDVFESGTSDTSSGNEFGTSDPFPADVPNESDASDSSFERVQNESDASDPFTTSERSTPPTPRQRGELDDAGSNPIRATGGPIPKPAPTSCPRHGTQTAPGCRGCGTTPRQVEAARRKADAQARRDAERLRLETERADAERRRATGPSPETLAALDKLRTHLKTRPAAQPTSRKATAR